VTGRAGYRRGLGWLLAPYLIGSTLLIGLPAVVTAGFAFFRYDAVTPARYAGLGVVRDLLGYPELRSALTTTAVFLAVAVPLRVAGALALALLLHRREPAAALGRVAVYVPVVLPDAATALVWLWVVNPAYGPLGVLGLTDSPLLLDSWGARITVIGISVLALGEGFVVTLAARRELPEQLYELARSEGAGGFTVFRLVTLPQLAPVLGLLAARDLVVSMQVVLVPTLLLTAGGPFGATLTMPVFIYELGFQEFRLGEAAAAALLLLIGTGLVVAVQFRLLRRWWRGGATL
jgi:multiple sugar transport system permease protein